MRIHEIAEEYLDRLIEGESPDRAAIVSLYPELADELERRLSLMDVLFRSRLEGGG